MPKRAVAILIVLCTPAPAAEPDFAFMPDGGRETLARMVADDRMDLTQIATMQADETAWQTMIATSDPDLGPKAVETLASYLAVVMPDGAVRSIDNLPADGKALAIENCQFCHSFFTGYLVQGRDAEGWRAIFKSPFHTELPMSDRQREIFARYSAINMPIPFDEVPEALRF